MGDRWPVLPLGLQALVWSYLTSFERLVSSQAPTPEVCVRYLEEPTSKWFSHNPDCTVPFLDWLMACCRRYRCLHLGTRPATPLGFLVTSRGCWSSSISVRLYPREPDLLVEEDSDDTRETLRESRVQVGKKNLERMCVVTKDYVVLQVPSPGTGPWNWNPLAGSYQCSNVWQGRYVLVFNYTEYCSLWCLTTSAVVRTIRCPSEVSCAYVEDERLIYLGAEDGTVCTYDPVEDMVLDRAGVFVFGKSEPKRVSHLLSLGPRRLLVGSEDSNRLVLVDTGERCRPVSFLSGHDSWISCVELSRDRSVLVSCDFNGGVRVWRVSSGAEIVLECQHQVDYNHVTCCAVSPDGTMVVVHSRYGANWVLLRSDGYQPVLVRQSMRRIESLSFDSTGKYLACAHTSDYLKCDAVYLVDTYCLRKRVWITRERVPVSYPTHTSFIDSQRLFVFSNHSHDSPTLHTVEWLDR